MVLKHLLRQLARAEFPSGEHRDRAGVVRLQVPVMTWDGYVRLAFEEIRRTGLWSPQVARRLRSALEDLCNVTLPERRPAVELQLQLLDEELSAQRKSDEERRISLTSDAQGIGSGSDVRS